MLGAGLRQQRSDFRVIRLIEIPIPLADCLKQLWFESAYDMVSLGAHEPESFG